MAIKAGRVGVNPADVDPVDGHISPSSVDSYTKTESDAKFETQTHAAATYETKSDAAAALAAKQPINLRVPIEMLSGTKLTVESALQGLNDVSTASFTDVSGSYQSGDSYIKRQGNVVDGNLAVNTVTGTAPFVLAYVPAGYRPASNVMLSIGVVRDTNNVIRGYISPEGAITVNGAVSTENVRVHFSYII